MLFNLELVFSQSYVYRTQKAVDYSDNDIGYNNINLESCLNWCSTTLNCIGVAYNPQSNADCWIKYQFPSYAIDPENPPAPGGLPSRDTIIKISNSSSLNYDYQMQPATSYTGNLLITFVNQPYTYCIAQCDIYTGAGCVVVVMDSVQNRCYLQSAISGLSTQNGLTAYLQVSKSTTFTTTFKKTTIEQLQTTISTTIIKKNTTAQLQATTLAVLSNPTSITMPSSTTSITEIPLFTSLLIATILNKGSSSNALGLFTDSPQFLYAIIALVAAILVFFVLLAMRSKRKQRKFIENSKVGSDGASSF